MSNHSEYIKFKGGLYRLKSAVTEPPEEIEEGPIPDSVVLEAKAGDLRARNRVIVAYLPRIMSRIRKYHVTDAQRDDLRQECVLALYEAINQWDPEAGVPFVQVAYFAIWNAASRFINRIHGRGEGGKQKPPKMIYLDEPLTEDAGEAQTSRHTMYPSLDPTPHALVEQQEYEGAIGQVVQYIKTMPGVYGELLRLSLLKNLTEKDIAKQLDLPRATAMRWLEQAKEKMRQDLGPLLEEAKKTMLEKELEPKLISPPAPSLKGRPLTR